MLRSLPLLFLLSAGCAAPGLPVSTNGSFYEIPLGYDIPIGGPAIRFSGEGLRVEPAGKLRLRLRASKQIRFEIDGRRSMALFPGLEFLEGAEPSSSDRDAKGALANRQRPEPWKVTVPLMAFEIDGWLVAVFWKSGLQPSFQTGDPNWMILDSPEGEVEAVVHVEHGATIYDAVPRWTEVYGLPEPEPWPRTLEEELALCKSGFDTVAAPRGKYRHAVGTQWTPEWAPGFGVLLHLLGQSVEWFDFPDLLSTANCHVLRWEAPFYAGEPKTAQKLVERMKLLTDMRKKTDGEWGFHPVTAEQRKLGTAGDSVLGTSAENAFSVVKAARMTGDPELKAIALDVLARMRRHKVPRGGQTWECPLYEPDLLAAAFAIGANVEAFKLSGDRAYLADASRWAKSGLPFLYLWSLPGRKGMRYASIPVFGTTQFTHPWFGVPVQWNGLVYAYFLRKLAPLDRGFDWLRVADGITASAVHQQYAEGPSKGCYPDGVYDQFTRRAPPDINPEDLLINILASIGKDPDPDLSVMK